MRVWSVWSLLGITVKGEKAHGADACVVGLGNIDILVCDYCEAKILQSLRLLSDSENCLQTCRTA